MTTAGGLETGYRRLLRWYPPSYRARHEEEILAVLMTAARPGQRWPGVRDSLDLVRSALKIRIRMTLRGATDSQPWAAALAMVGVLIPLLMLLLKLTIFLDMGTQRGFGTPADVLIGAYGEPGTFTGMFHGNPYSAALAFNVTQMLTAGPVPALALAALACLGWRRAAAAVAASVLLAYLGITLTHGYNLLVPREDVTLYAYGLEALILLITPGAARGWRALPWRPSALLATATVAAGVGMNGGIEPLFYHPHVNFNLIGPAAIQREMASLPHGFMGRLFGVGPGEWGDWLLYQGTLVAVIAVALITMLVSSPVSRRALSVLAVPFALGAVMYLCSLVYPPLPPTPVNNALACAPLLLTLLAAMALSLVRRRRAGTDPGPTGGVRTNLMP